MKQSEPLNVAQCILNYFLFFYFRNAAHGFSLIPVDNLKVTMKEILQKALKKRKGSQKGSGNDVCTIYSLLSLMQGRQYAVFL